MLRANRLSTPGTLPGLLLLSLLLPGLLIGCAGGEKRSGRVDPDVDDALGGTGIDSADVRAIADKMVGRILSTPEIARAANAPTIVLQPVDNGTRFVIDTDILLLRLRGELGERASGRVRFLARENLAQIEQERTAKRDGVFTASSEKSLLGADFFLTGTLRSISKARGGDRSDYILYSFTLIDAEDSTIVWEGQHEVKKVGTRGTIYR
ncbi:MAG: penicillin-binding protein activator LpoB [Planctomycetota bacterium]|jgi:PBP1b-binding outer membrane lipoprotein LpoB